MNNSAVSFIVMAIFYLLFLFFAFPKMIFAKGALPGLAIIIVAIGAYVTIKSLYGVIKHE